MMNKKIIKNAQNCTKMDQKLLKSQEMYVTENNIYL